MMKSLFAELKRRNVFKVGIAYVIVAWVGLQFVDVMAQLLELPKWFGKAMFVLLATGFPIALVISWAYELTPQGLIKTADVKKAKTTAPKTGGRINKVIAVGLALALAFIAYDKMYENPVPAVTEAKAAQASIAVLPFTNLSGDPEQEYFSDGISEEILNVLVRVEGLSVASRTSAFAFKGRDLGLSEIAGELQVDYVLEGSVRRADQTIRITAQLIDARTDRHLWSETYDREFKDIFQIQDEISNAIVGALKNTLGVEKLKTVSVEALTDNMSAYELYLKGRELFIARTDLLESIALLEQAVAIDPNFSQAWATLAAVYSVAPFWGIEDDRGYFQLAEKAGRRALELDPEISMAYAVLGSLKSLSPSNADSWIESLNELGRAIELDPKNTTALLWRGIVYRSLGFFDQSIADVEQCVEMDPGYQNCNRHLALAYHFKGDYETAVNLYNKTLEANSVDMADAFVFPMLKTGNRAGALLLADRATGGARAPIGAWIRAMENPGQISAIDRQAFETWRAGKKVSFFAPFTFYLAFKDYENLPVLIGDNDFQWHPLAKEWRKTPGFKQFVEELGILGYWRKAGFPPQCRPKGNADFECD